MAEQARDQEGPPSNKKKIPLKPILILALIMLVEGAIFGMWMVFSDPKSAPGADMAAEGKAEDTTAERKLLQISAPNTKSGRVVYHDIEISIMCEKEEEEMVEAICTKRDGQIRDRLRTIIAKAEPEYFKEEDLRTLKRQIQIMLDELLGEGVIQKVYIPQCRQYRGN